MSHPPGVGRSGAGGQDFPMEPEEKRDYSTLGGYIVKQFGRVPTEGESISAGNYLVEVIDMDRHRIDKVVLLPLKHGPGEAVSGAAPTK